MLGMLREKPRFDGARRPQRRGFGQAIGSHGRHVGGCVLVETRGFLCDAEMAMDQYLYIPCLGGWTSINPSYFDVNYRGIGFWAMLKSKNHVDQRWSKSQKIRQFRLTFDLWDMLIYLHDEIPNCSVGRSSWANTVQLLPALRLCAGHMGGSAMGNPHDKWWIHGNIWKHHGWFSSKPGLNARGSTGETSSFYHVSLTNVGFRHVLNSRKKMNVSTNLAWWWCVGYFAWCRSCPN